jgi:hypothetical protein
MSRTTLNREQAHLAYGPEFVQFMMKGKSEIELNAAQRVLLEKWKLIKKLKFAPFAYEYVYIVADDTAGQFKIGMTRSPKSRLSALQTGSTNNLRIVGLVIIGGQNGRNLERSLHAEYKRRQAHVKGEWFTGDPIKELPFIRDFATLNYRGSVTSLSDAWDGCEPLVALYSAAHRDTANAVDMAKCRADFMWVLGQAEKGVLTVLS